MTSSIAARQLVLYLRSRPRKGRFLDRLKISYRPYISPFNDLLYLISEGDRIFDVGCGSGQFCLLAGRFARPSWIGGVEIDARLVENADQLFRGAGFAIPYEFGTFDGLSFPASVGSADKVFLIDVLHHVPRAAQRGFLQSLYSAMSPGADLIVKDIDAGSPLVYCNKIHDLIFAGEIGNELTIPATHSLTQAAGFKVRTTSKRRMWCYPHFTLTASK